MKPFSWNESMSVGIGRFDEQHRKLMGYINDLSAAMSAGEGKARLPEIMEALTDYTRTHFSAEEEVMSANDYTETVSHKAEHEYFISRLEEFRDRLAKGGLFLSMDVMEFLQGWLTEHIMGTDKRYTRFLNKQGVT